MGASKRVFINTIAQYTKAVINTCLSLYTVRLVLSALGQSDYGIFSLVAGIVAMLGFVINAMVITTQRYLSFYQGKNDTEKQRKYFSNSFLLHLCIGIIISIILLMLKDFLCHSFLNIADERRAASGIVYIITVFMLLLSFLSSPFKAAIIAHENIVYISIIEVLDGIMKLVLAVCLLGLRSDKLIVYVFILMCIYMFELLAYSAFSIKKYDECCPSKFWSDFDKSVIRELGGFVKWTTYGMGAVLLRTQGLSILINKFFGTILNASYGIALQMFGAVSFISSSLINAMNPILMRSEGKKDRAKMLAIAEKESKFIVTIMSLIFIPLIMEMDSILHLWLKEVPPMTPFLCRCFLICFLIDQSTYGLNSANQAIGNIRNYTILMYTPKLLFLPFALIMFNKGYSISTVMLLFITIELFVALIRIPYIHYSAGLEISVYCKNVFLRLTPMIIIMVCFSWVIHLLNFPFRFLCNFIISGIAGCAVAWICVLTKEERHIIYNIILRNEK